MGDIDKLLKEAQNTSGEISPDVTDIEIAGKKFKKIKLPFNKYDDIEIDYIYDGIGRKDSYIQFNIVDQNNKVVGEGQPMGKEYGEKTPYCVRLFKIYPINVWGYHAPEDNYNPAPYWLAIEQIDGCDFEYSIDSEKKAEGKNFVHVKFIEKGEGKEYRDEQRGFISSDNKQLEIAVGGIKDGSVNLVFFYDKENGVETRKQTVSFNGGRLRKEEESGDNYTYREYESDYRLLTIEDNPFAVVAIPDSNYKVESIYGKNLKKSVVELTLIQKESEDIVSTIEFDDMMKTKWGEKNIDKLVLKTPQNSESKEYKNITIKNFKIEDRTRSNVSYNMTYYGNFQEDYEKGKRVFNNAFQHINEGNFEIKELKIDGQDFSELAKKKYEEENLSTFPIEFRYKIGVNHAPDSKYKYDVKLGYNISEDVSSANPDDGEYKPNEEDKPNPPSGGEDKPNPPSGGEDKPVPPEEDKPTLPSIPDVPVVPSIIPSTPEIVENPVTVPEENPVVDIAKEDDTPLGGTKNNDDDGTYTSVDEDDTPEGIPEVPEEVKVSADKSPLGTLPTTGGSNGDGLVVFGVALLGLGFVTRKKFK